MKQTNPRIERLKQMMSLEERRVALQQELDQVEQQMNDLKESLFSDEAAPVRTSVAAPKAATKSSKATPRGALKDRIVAALEAAGGAGVRVKELAQALGTKPVNVHSWFHSSMKRYPAIKKIEGGHYRLEGSLEDKSPKTVRAKREGQKAPARKGRGGKGRQSKRGELSARIMSELENAGSEGITVRDIAEKLGANYKNIYIWFATTGKKNNSVKKVGPAQYRLAR